MSCGIPAPASWAYALQYPALAGQAYAFGYLDAGSLRVLRVILLSRQTAVKADLRPAAVVVIAVECRGLKTIIAENFLNWAIREEDTVIKGFWVFSLANASSISFRPVP